MQTRFDRNAVFAKSAFVLVGAAAITVPYIGFWLFIPVGVVLYVTWQFCTYLEKEDRKDAKRFRKRSRRY